MQLFLIAWRSLGRNRQRTLITALTVAFGVLASVALQGLCAAFVTSVIEAKVDSRLGAVQVFRKGHLATDEPLKLSLPWEAALVARILRTPGVTAVAPRLDFDGLVSNGAEATMFLATAIDPELEYRVCPRRRKQVSPGSEPLQPGRQGDMLIGKTLAESLGAGKSSTLIMQAVGPHGRTNALDVEVGGFLPTTDFVESTRVATVRLAFAQDLLRMPGQVTSYAIGVAELPQAAAVAARLRTELGDGYEVATWAELDPGTKTRVLTVDYAFSLVAIMLFFLAATGIVNTMLMSVYERVREIGTMLSFGVRRWQITLLFLWEAGLLGLLSALAGSALGHGIVYLLGRRGIYGPMAGGDPLILYPRVGPGFLGAAVGLAVIGAILAGLYPAWKAARLRPVDALRAN